MLACVTAARVGSDLGASGDRDEGKTGTPGLRERNGQDRLQRVSCQESGQGIAVVSQHEGSCGGEV